MNLKEAAMLTVFSASQWRAQKQDKNISQEVATIHGSDAEMGRFNKILIGKDEIRAIQKVVNEARTYHYQVTLPWLDQGQRILTAAMFPEYSGKMQNLKGNFQAAVGAFTARYDLALAEAKRKLNGLFDQADYPPVHRLIDKFRFEVKFYPMPETEDWRITIDPQMMEEVRANTEASIKTGLMEAVRELYTRLFEVVNNLRDKLTEADPLFRDSLVGNIARLCAIIPRMNLTNDPKLTELQRETEKELTRYSPDELRESEDARKQMVQKAEDILKKISGVIG